MKYAFRLRDGAGRRGALALALVSLLVGLGACARNPATGSQMLNFMSLDEETKIGAEEHPKLVAELGGEVTDPALTKYVDSVGQLLARTSELPNLKFSFTVLDTDMVNAVALPGGYVHVTRGLLALANSEAELAGVIAHEIGHVTARHAAQRHSRSVIAGVGVGLLGILTRSRELANLAGTGANLYLKSYSRDHEFEADTLGVRYLARAGFDTRAMSSFLGNLRAYARLEAEAQGLPPDKVDETNLMATHPRTVERVERAAAAAGARNVANPITGREVYLRKIDGLIYGDSPAQGFARGRDFLHPELRFRFSVPEGFELRNTPKRVLAKGPGDAFIVFDGAKRPGRGSALDYLVNVWARGARVTDREVVRINGLEAATGSARVRTKEGLADFRLVAIVDGGQIWRMLFVTRAAETARWSGPFRSATYSFRKVSAAEAARWQPWRVRLHRVGAGDTVARLAARQPFGRFNVARFEVLNGLTPGARLQPGTLVKYVSAN